VRDWSAAAATAQHIRGHGAAQMQRRRGTASRLPFGLRVPSGGSPHAGPFRRVPLR
jgi:hypothetical protein